jgi:hypothetical protein
MERRDRHCSISAPSGRLTDFRITPLDQKRDRPADSDATVSVRSRVGELRSCNSGVTSLHIEGEINGLGRHLIIIIIIIIIIITIIIIIIIIITFTGIIWRTETCLLHRLSATFHTKNSSFHHNG